MRDLTQGSVTRHVLHLAVFLAVSMVFQTLYYLVDLYFVSRLIAFGTEYLRIISWNFAGMALIFTSSSLFQALGNTWPSLASSALRLFIFAAPAAALSLRPGFTIRQVWYLSVATVAIQAVSNLVLLHREFRRKLTFAAPPPMAEVSAAGELG
ncbi:MAG: hypothetical protein ACHP7P_00855 [Terriglobales bacterium]